MAILIVAAFPIQIVALHLDQISYCAKVFAVLNLCRPVDAAAPKPVRPG